MQKGKLLVISGPSAGVGKDTLLEMFKKAHPDWQNPLSTTTRLPRAGEANGLNYNFVDRDTFEAWAKTGKFLEFFDVTGNLYGTLREPVEELMNQGQNVVLRKEYQGALDIKRQIPAAIIAFLMAENLDTLRHRMQKRGDKEQTIHERLELAQTEIAHKDQFDRVIINPEGHPEQALTDLEKAVDL